MASLLPALGSARLVADSGTAVHRNDRDRTTRRRCSAMSPGARHGLDASETQSFCREVPKLLGYRAAFASADFADHVPHLVGAESAQRRRTDVALTGDRQQRGGERLIVGCLDDAHYVVAAESPIDVREFDAH
jgi:hypothetical protein